MYAALASYYDYAMVLMGVIEPLLGKIHDAGTKFDGEYNISKDISEEEFMKIIYNNLDKICEDFKYDKKYVKILKKYWEILVVMPIFLYDMKHNNSKNNMFPNKKIKKLLHKIFDK